MAENTVDLRTTTISLDEYNKLNNEVNALRETKGALQTTITNLNSKVHELNEKQPVVKVIHFTKEWENEYDDWNDEIKEHQYLRQSKVEYVNLTEVESLARAKAKEELKDKLEASESATSSLKNELKYIRENLTTTQDQLSDHKKMISKLDKQHKEDLDEKTELYNKNVESLKKAQKEDEKEYKDTIKDLKEEIQKVKDDKTQKDIENKRNQEIKDLKGRIKDLEGMIEELGKLNFFKRVFKLRTISAEKLAVQVELAKREQNANKVGTTWVSENGKYRKYNAFSEKMNELFHTGYDKYILGNMYTTVRGWF
jgi:chromosome segregation ATPase